MSYIFEQLSYQGLVWAGLAISTLITTSINLKLNKRSKNQEEKARLEFEEAKKADEAKLKVIQDLSAKLEIIEDGVEQLLRDLIIGIAESYIELGYITLSATDRIERAFKKYQLLGGNGGIENLVKQAKELPMKKANKQEDKKNENCIY